MKKVYIKTFGCAQNTADSERIKTYYFDQGYELADDWKGADVAVVNTCVVRESAENRVYGLINNIKTKQPRTEVIVTGCLVGIADNDKTGKKMKELKARVPEVNKWMPISEISFSVEPLRDKKKAALIPISSGCGNFCSYCIVPFSRGAEVSRPFAEIMAEIDRVMALGFKEIVLVGQNVNSYGSDLVKAGEYELPNGEKVTPVMVKSMGKPRVPTLFPYLLAQAAKKNLDKISFVSSNPWDFSDELIETIAKYPNIDRLLHLPFQAGDDEILKKMNRGYTKQEYLDLVDKIKAKVMGVKFSTDIIIGFPGEDETAFQNTVDVCKKVGFDIAYLNKYSPRRGTVSAKMYKNDIPMNEKKRRWEILNELVNVKHGQS